MSVMDDEWSQVAASSGEYAQMNALTNHLLIVFPIGYIEHSQTKFTVPGKKSDVVICDFVDLDDADESGAPGKVYRTQWWRGAFLIAGLRPRIGSKVLGRLGKGIARNGMNAPWVISDMVSDPDCLTRARAWGQAHSTFLPSEFQPPSTQYAAPPPPPPQPQPQYGPPPQNGYPGDPYAAGPAYPSPGGNGYPGQGQPQYPPPAPPQPQPQYGQQGGYPGDPYASTGGGYPGQQQAPPRFPVGGGAVSGDERQMLDAFRMAQQARQQGQDDNPPF